MKKIYLSIIALTASLSSVFAQTVPTCSLDPIFISGNRVGVWPDSITNFISGTVGQPYEQNLTVKVPKDTTSTGIRFCFNRFEITTPTGITNYNMPPGLTLGSSTSSLNGPSVAGAPSLKMPGNANNCASIYGVPTTAGSYTLSIKVTPFITASPITQCPNNPDINGGSGSLTAPQTLNYYIINIAPAVVGVKEFDKNLVNQLQNQPNPFTGKTIIKFSVESEDQATLTVYNALGAIVYSNSLKTSAGENKFELNAENWSSGVYMYSVKFKNSVSTKRLMINN